MPIKIKTFVAVYAKWDENVPYYALKNVALPYDAESEMIVFASGHSDGGAEPCQVKVALYDGISDDLMTDKLKYLVGKTLHVNPDEDGNFELLAPTGIRPVPSDKLGVVRQYTVALFADDEQEKTAALGIGRFPVNPHKAVTPLTLNVSRKEEDIEDPRIIVKVTFRSLLSYVFHNTVSICYFESRREPESPLDLNENVSFVRHNIFEEFCPGKPVCIDTDLLISPQREKNLFCWCVILLGGVPMLLIPLSDDTKYSLDSCLIPYPPKRPKQNTTKAKHVAGSKEPVSINLLDYAPENFKTFLQYLRDVVTYNEGRKQQELSTISSILRGRHYIITGNEGVGKEEAARAIYEELKRLGVVRSFSKQDAIKLYDSNDGFSNSISELIEDNRNSLIYIQNADSLGRKGAVNSIIGIEVLCNHIYEQNNCVVILSGNRHQLLELINGNVKAQRIFSEIFHFEDLHEETLHKYALRKLDERECSLTDEASHNLYEYMKFLYSMRGSHFTNTKYVEQVIENHILHI